jgi:hypothetical protein
MYVEECPKCSDGLGAVFHYPGACEMRPPWALPDPYLPKPTVATETPRCTAEEKVRVILDECNEQTLALLFQTLRNAGWSTDKAGFVLRKAGWVL